jgi:hypothetical protein
MDTLIAAVPVPQEFPPVTVNGVVVVSEKETPLVTVVEPPTQV